MTEISDNSRNFEDSEAISRLASEFGISVQEANAAVEALMPGVATALKAKASDLEGFSTLLGVEAPALPVAAMGRLADLPISDAEREALVARAAGATGLAPSLLNKMLPVIGSLVASAILKAINKRGLGAILGDLAKLAGAGGLGAILGQVLGGGRADANQGHTIPAPTPEGAPRAPSGGIDLGTILEQILRGAAGKGQAGPVPPQGNPQANPQAPSGGIDFGTIFEQILRGGHGQASEGQTNPVPPHGSPPGSEGGIDLGTILGQILRGDSSGLPRPGESQPARTGLDDEIGKILRGTRD
jgi:hypothetical protein